MATLFQVHFFSRWPNQSFRKKTLPTTWMSKRNVNWKLGRCRRKLFGRRELDRFPVRHQRRCHRIASSVSGEDAFFLFFILIRFRFDSSRQRIAERWPQAAMTWKRLPCSSFPDDSFSCKNNNNNKQQNQAISLASSTSKRTNQRFTSRRFCGNTAASHWPTMGRPTNQRRGNRPRAAGQTKDERFTGQQPKNNKSIITKQRPNIKVILGFHDRYGHGLHFV